MDKNKAHRRLSRGGGRWQAPRMQPVVKKAAQKTVKKAKKAPAQKKSPSPKKK